MWPFTKQSEDQIDERPPSAGAKAIAASLESEPLRWRIASNNIRLLVHDSGIEVDIEGGTIRAPWLGDEPDANWDLLISAADKWIAARLPIPTQPKPAIETESEVSR